MNATAQESQQLLTEAIQKQMLILGTEITLLKVRNVAGLVVKDDGTVSSISGNMGEIVTHFLEQFRELSSPLVKKTMQPLLSTMSTVPTPPTSPPTSSQPIINQNKV
jgi:hypothetical protein